MAALIPDEKGLVLDGYQFLKEYGLVPSIAEPSLSPLSSLPSSQSYSDLFKPHVQLNLSTLCVYCVRETCV